MATDKVIDTIEITDGAPFALLADTTKLYVVGPVICSGISHRFAGGLRCSVYGFIQHFMPGMGERLSVINTANDALTGTVPSPTSTSRRAFRLSSSLETPENRRCR